MPNHYKIAGLVVEMDSFGRTAEQAKPYQINEQPHIDIRIQPDHALVWKKMPNLEKEDCEYLATGVDFYAKLLSFDGFRLHASAVVVDEKAYLFTAASGTGKSTHTNLWLNYFGERAYILNDDKPALRMEDGIWYAYGTPWSGKHNINKNTRVPLAGIACLERSETNTIEPYFGSDAILAIMRQSNKPKDMNCRLKLMELLDKLITQVPIWKLQCNKQTEAAIVAYEAMSGDSGRK